MKRVYTAADLPQAFLLSHLLEHAGIPHYISNQNLQGGVGELPFTHTYPDIWILDESDFQRARVVIDGFEDASLKQGVWRCEVCGEENPPTFELCWSCGRVSR